MNTKMQTMHNYKETNKTQIANINEEKNLIKLDVTTIKQSMDNVNYEMSTLNERINSHQIVELDCQFIDFFTILRPFWGKINALKYRELSYIAAALYHFSFTKMSIYNYT